jgi:hypothetical protein
MLGSGGTERGGSKRRFWPDEVNLEGAEFEGEQRPVRGVPNGRAFQDGLPIVDEVGTSAWPRAEEIRKLLVATETR